MPRNPIPGGGCRLWRGLAAAPAYATGHKERIVASIVGLITKVEPICLSRDDPALVVDMGRLSALLDKSVTTMDLAGNRIGDRPAVLVESVGGSGVGVARSNSRKQQRPGSYSDLLQTLARLLVVEFPSVTDRLQAKG